MAKMRPERQRLFWSWFSGLRIHSAMYGLILSETEPALNLATEELLFRRLPQKHPGWFLLWQNKPSLIIGRYQTAALEIDLNAREAIPVVRRITGGGAVYHDAGNLNFSFIINSSKNLQFSHFLEQIKKALRQLGVQAETSSRNDLLCGGKKISGSSMLTHQNKVLFHGTLLIDADYNKIGKLLTPAKSKLEKHGVKSISMRVGSLTDYWKPGTDLPTLKNVLLKACSSQERELSEEIKKDARALASWKYLNPEWNMGQNRTWNKIRNGSFAWGTVQLRLFCHDKKILDCAINGDFFSNNASFLENLIIGKSIPDLKKVLRNIDWPSMFAGCNPEEAFAFFSEENFQDL